LSEKKKSPAVKTPAKVKEGHPKKGPAQCVFDLYDLKFGMTRGEILKILELAESGHMGESALKKAGAEEVECFFDHEDRLWQVKAKYPMSGPDEAEALLERMSQDYRFQTPSARIAFDLTARSDETAVLSIRYTEANLKRIYIHHLMAVGAAKLAAAEEMERAIREKEEEEYIPTGPLIF
jgi:hypothetical protein